MRRLFALVAVLVLVTTACKIETNFGAVINADGTGTIVLELGVDEEAAQFFLDGSDPFEDQDLADSPDARTREETRGDLTFYIVEADVDDITESQTELVDAEGGVLENLTITVSNDRVSVNGSASAEDTVGAGTDGLDLDLDIEEIFSATVFFTMPGSIVSHNADRQEGNTLYWNVPITGGALDIQAESDPTGTPASDGGFPIWAIGILAALVLGALWYFNQSRTNDSGDEPSDTTDDAPPPAPSE
jgi:hypothetical protein